MTTRSFVLLALTVAACGPKPPPGPPTPPTPSPVCLPGQYDCYHNPGSGWIYACPVYDASGAVVGVQNESGPEKCPAPPQSPEVPPLIPDEQLIAKPGDTAVKMWNKTWAAISLWRSAHAEKWRPDFACLTSSAEIDGAYTGIAIELAKMGVIAQQSVTESGQKSDCIFVNRTGTNEYEEIHAFEYGRGCVATGQNAVKGVYTRSTTSPPVPPPVTDKCPFEPCPPKFYEDGVRPHWHFNVKPHTMGNCDSTPVVDKACDFCKAIGLGCQNEDCSIPRCACPVRLDDHPERQAVELWLLGGQRVLDSRNGQDCRPNNTPNPFAFLCNTGNCRICNADKTVCSNWF